MSLSATVEDSECRAGTPAACPVHTGYAGCPGAAATFKKKIATPVENRLAMTHCFRMPAWADMTNRWNCPYSILHISEFQLIIQ